MNSQEIQLAVVDKVTSLPRFDAPYGVLSGSHVNKKGKRYLSVTFGKRRTLDVEVQIYNRKFIIVRQSRTGSELFNSAEELLSFIDTL